MVTQQSISYPDSVDGMYEHLQSRLKDVVPDFELKMKAEVACEVNRLKQKKNAVILGHNYMEPALFHSVPDYTGDSLFLSRVSAEAQAEVIVFCGVRFMAETAKILNPDRTVLLPSAKGGCSLAESVRAHEVEALKALYPDAVSVTYVNCYADVKAGVDYVCTSGNAEAVVQHLLDEGHKQIIFLPDEYLAANVAKSLNLPIVFPEGTGVDLKRSEDPGKDQAFMIGWRGRCEVHDKFTVEDVSNARKQFPDVQVLSHPECSPEVVAVSDYSGSTTQMIRYVENMKSGRYLLLTECTMGDNIASKNPDREMIRLCSVRCPHMNEISLEETLEALKQDRYVIDVPEGIAKKARTSLDRMLKIG